MLPELPLIAVMTRIPRLLLLPMARQYGSLAGGRSTIAPRSPANRTARPRGDTGRGARVAIASLGALFIVAAENRR